ncbi:hypothetical protein LTR46_005511 [Exophiala xenobiotica]|nr:hypothetical protein LTR46_005511 [Exophiala xenobiotica]
MPATTRDSTSTNLTGLWTLHDLQSSPDLPGIVERREICFGSTRNFPRHGDPVKKERRCKNMQARRVLMKQSSSFRWCPQRAVVVFLLRTVAFREYGLFPLFHFFVKPAQYMSIGLEGAFAKLNNCNDELLELQWKTDNRAVVCGRTIRERQRLQDTLRSCHEIEVRLEVDGKRVTDSLPENLV